MKEELIKEMESNLSLVMDYNEYSEDCGYGDQNYIDFEYNKMAKELIDIGWTKTIWHKIAGGDLPKEKQNVLIAFKGFQTNKIVVISGFYLEGDFMNENSSKIRKDHVIAWTDLPEYKE